MKKQTILALVGLAIMGVFSVTGCGGSKGGNGIAVAYSPNKTSATANGYTGSNGELTWHDSTYNRDFAVEAVNQQGTPLPNIHVQIFSGSNAAFAIFIDPTYTYEPYITTVTDQLGNVVTTTSLNGLSLLPEDNGSTVSTIFKVGGTLLDVSKTAISQGFDISPQYNLTPQDVQLLMNELPSFSQNQFYDTITDASNALANDLEQRTANTAFIFGGGCAVGAVLGGGWNLGAGAVPGCMIGVSIASFLADIAGVQQAGIADVVTISSGISSVFSNEPIDQRYTIADLQAGDLAGDFASYVVHVPGGKAKIILPIDPDSLTILPASLTFNTTLQTQNVSVMAQYTYFNKSRSPSQYIAGRFSDTINPVNIAQVSQSSDLNSYEITKTAVGSGTITFNFKGAGNVISGLLNISDSGSTPPNPPTNLTAVAGNGQVSLSWITSTGATSYKIYDSTTSGSGYVNVGITTTTGYTVTGLTNGTLYYFTVTAVNSAGESGSSNVASATPLINPVGTEFTYTVGNNPNGIAIDASGNVWTANENDGTVTKLSSNGSVIGTFTAGTYPWGIAIDASGNVWVVNNTCGGTVTKLASNGSLIGTYSVGCYPSNLAIDKSGNVWVVNNNTSSVTELSSSGSVIGNYSTPWQTYAVAVDASGNVWVVSRNDISGNPTNYVTELNSSGTAIGTFYAGKSPQGIAIDASGNVWVVNSGDGTVTKLSSSGMTIGTYSVGTSPIGIAIDASGNVWVTNNDSSKTVAELNSSGTIIGTYALGLVYPSGIAIDASGNVWVTGHICRCQTGNGNTITKIMGITTGPQYWPYAGPQWP
ncbi:MAG: fibronectin type III domain-containing protein [Deltaproteobacteria bacterium]|nr:fibronectin type III domain-containing protein [Deltaproteobacteria bacterium]MCL5277295.1 fibronectin type III domain-containing protein [Deltaproteobacteria bacterium]